MNQELQRIYNESPAKSAVSRLDPFKDLILRWHRDGRSYPAICELLRSQCGVQISKSPLRRYVLRRSRRRSAPVLAEPIGLPAGVASMAGGLKRSEAEKAALRLSAKASNHKPTIVYKERQELFVFDEDKPLTNKPEEKKAWQQQR